MVQDCRCGERHLGCRDIARGSREDDRVATTSSHSETSTNGTGGLPSIPGRPFRRALRAQLRTTPGRLRLIAAGLVAAAILLGVIVWGAERSRANAANAVATQTEPLLAKATNLYASLSDADATVASTFVNGGIEPPPSRARYVRDLGAAASELAALAKRVRGNPQAAAAIATIGSQLPVYNGFVGEARGDNRQRLPLGAAYLRRASERLRTTILPAAGSLFLIEAASLGGDYATGGDDAALAVFVIGMLVLLAMFVAAQVYLGRTTRRTFNVPLVLATLALLVVAVWGTAGLLSEQSSLSSSRSAGVRRGRGAGGDADPGAARSARREPRAGRAGRGRVVGPQRGQRDALTQREAARRCPRRRRADSAPPRRRPRWRPASAPTWPRRVM